MAGGRAFPPPPSADEGFASSEMGQHRFEIANGSHSLVIDLPGFASLDGVELDVGTSQLRLGVPRHQPRLIPLPTDVSWTEAVAKFSKKRHQLVLSVPAKTAGPAVATSCEQFTAPTGRKAGYQSPESSSERVAEEESTALESATHVPDRQGIQVPGQTQPSAYGSVWNANSWHWEEKNCLDLAQAAVFLLLDRASADGGQLRHVRELDGICFAVSGVDVSGEASFNLRRGKRILCFELTVSFKWEARDEFGSKLGAKGVCNVAGLTQDEDAPETSVEVSAHSSGGRWARAAGDWMRRQGAKFVSQCLSGPTLSQAILAAEDARCDAAGDRVRREAERAKREEALKSSETERARIAAEEREREAMRRKQAPQAAGDAVKGSVWNVNAWHWEERPMTEWSKAWLERELSALSLSMLAGLARLTLSESQAVGDASVSVRKGRPIVLFQLNITCKWEAKPEVEGIGEAKGTICVPDFTSEEQTEAAKIEVDVAQDKSRGRLASAVRQDGLRAVRAILERFVEALRAQLPANHSEK